jgi:hypothetical protein
MAYRRSELKTLITLHAMSMPEQPAAGPAGPNGTPAAPPISPDGIDEEGVVVATAGPTGHDHMLLSKDEVRWGLRCVLGPLLSHVSISLQRHRTGKSAHVDGRVVLTHELVWLSFLCCPSLC